MHLSERLALAVCALWLALPLLPFGCNSVGVERAKALNVDIDALNVGARADLAKAAPEANDIGKGHIRAADSKLVQQSGKIKEQSKELDAVGKARARDQQAVKQANAEIDKLNNSWAMWIGRGILAAFWFVVIGWVVLQVGGGLLLGRGIGSRVVEPVLDAVWGSNLGYWVADKSRKTGAK